MIYFTKVRDEADKTVWVAHPNSINNQKTDFNDVLCIARLNSFCDEKTRNHLKNFLRFISNIVDSLV